MTRTKFKTLPGVDKNLVVAKNNMYWNSKNPSYANIKGKIEELINFAQEDQNACSDDVIGVVKEYYDISFKAKL